MSFVGPGWWFVAGGYVFEGGGGSSLQYEYCYGEGIIKRDREENMGDVQYT